MREMTEEWNIHLRFHLLSISLQCRLVLHTGGLFNLPFQCHVGIRTDHLTSQIPLIDKITIAYLLYC